uniref:Uncharacterized protein n=1 Tax=Glossina pallidipes TaxID=7398 RepID=A0A1B0AD67_GLOPL
MPFRKPRRLMQLVADRSHMTAFKSSPIISTKLMRSSSRSWAPPRFCTKLWMLSSMLNGVKMLRTQKMSTVAKGVARPLSSYPHPYSRSSAARLQTFSEDLKISYETNVCIMTEVMLFTYRIDLKSHIPCIKGDSLNVLKLNN